VNGCNTHGGFKFQSNHNLRLLFSHSKSLRFRDPRGVLNLRYLVIMNICPSQMPMNAIFVLEPSCQSLLFHLATLAPPSGNFPGPSSMWIFCVHIDENKSTKFSATNHKIDIKGQ